MYKSIQDIHEAFDKAGLKHQTDRMGEKDVLLTSISTKVATYNYIFIKSDDSGNDVTVRIMKLAHYSENQWLEAYKLINQLQSKYRFAKFVLDSDGDLNVHYDFPVAYQDIGKGAVELILALSKVMDNAYPELMRLQWQ